MSRLTNQNTSEISNDSVNRSGEHVSNNKCLLIFIGIVLISVIIIIPIVLLGKNEGETTKTTATPKLGETTITTATPKLGTTTKTEVVTTEMTTAMSIEENESVITYNVSVFTVNAPFDGIDANIHLILYGENNKSETYGLNQSSINRNSFERNQQEVLEIKSIPLGNLRKIQIWFDNFGSASDWHLDRIEILDLNSDQLYSFIFQNWIKRIVTNEHLQIIFEDDWKKSFEIPENNYKENALVINRKRISRSLNDSHSEIKEIFNTYQINITTSNIWGSGTNAKVYIIIFDEYNNNTGQIPLIESKTYKDPFESGHTDLFEIENINIGKPRKIKIGHDNSGFASDWLLEDVTIYVPKYERIWIFSYGKWLSQSKNELQFEIEPF